MNPANEVSIEELGFDLIQIREGLENTAQKRAPNPGSELESTI